MGLFSPTRLANRGRSIYSFAHCHSHTSLLSGFRSDRGVGGIGVTIGLLHMLQNAPRRLFRPAVGCIQRQGVWVLRFKQLKLVEPPRNRGQVDLLKPRPAFRSILALAESLVVAGQPHGIEPGLSLLRQSLDPAEQRFIPGYSSSSTFVKTKLSSGVQKSRMTVKTALRIFSI